MKRILALESLLSVDQAAPAEPVVSITPTEVVGAVTDIENARAVNRAAQAIDISDEIGAAADDNGDIAEAMATLRDADGTVAVESYMLAQHAVRASGSLQHFVGESYGPSLESFNGGSRVSVAMEAATGHIAESIGAVGERWVTELTRSFAFINTRRAILRVRAKMLKDDAGKVSGSATTIHLPAYQCSTATGTVRNLTSAYVGSSKILTGLCKGYFGELVDIYKHNANLCGTVVDSDDAAFKKTFSAMTASWRRPKTNGTAINAAFVGSPLFTSLSVSSTVSEIAAFQKRAFSDVLSGPLKVGRPDHSPREVKAIAPGEVASIIAAVEESLDAVNGLSAFVKSYWATLRSMPTPLPVTLLLSNAAMLLTTHIPLSKFPGHVSHPQHAREMRRALRQIDSEARYCALDLAIEVVSSAERQFSAIKASLKAAA